jgi:hypothetical protein
MTHYMTPQSESNVITYMKDNHFSMKSCHESANHLVKVSRNYYRHLLPALRETTVIMTYEKQLVYDKLALFVNSYHLVKNNVVYIIISL